MSDAMQLIDAIERLPALPETHQRLVAVLGNENTPIRTLVDIVEQDAAMTANVLKLANSSLFPGRKVAMVRDAINRLGLTELLNFTLAELFHGMARSVPAYGLSASELWLHSVAAQAAATELRAIRPEAGIPPTASTAALLHDIGKLVLAEFLHADASRIDALLEEDQQDWLSVERQLVGIDHAAAGGRIARRWNFPELLVSAIESHHRIQTETVPLIDAVIVADQIAKASGFGVGKHSLRTIVDEKAYQRLNLSVIDFSRLCASTGSRVQIMRGLMRVA